MTDTTDRPRILCAYLSDGMVKTEFAEARMAAVMAASQDYHVISINTQTSRIERGRHLVAMAALEQQVDYVVFTDSDMVFPQDAITRLIGHDVDIVGAGYPTRRLPIRTTINDLEGNPFTIQPGMTGLMPVSHLGFGLICIKIEVFKRLKEIWDEQQKTPWWVAALGNFGGALFLVPVIEKLAKDEPSHPRIAPWFYPRFIPETNAYWGEDVNFCHNAIEAGFHVMCDLDLSMQVQHIGSIGYHYSMLEPVPDEVAEAAE